MDWLTLNWEFVIALMGIVLGSGGLLAWLRFRKVEAPLSEADLRSKEAKNYEQLLRNLADQGTQIANLSGKLDEEREKRRLLEDRVDELEGKLTIKDRQIEMYHKGYVRLAKQVRRLGEEPIWSPEG
jgi:uncharacterized protein involved in exopolysaccharide biosynthesis